MDMCQNCDTGASGESHVNCPSHAVFPNLARMNTPSPVSRPWGFRDVVALASGADGSSWEVPIPGIVWGQFQSGPNLFALAAVVHEIDPRATSVGQRSATPCGFQGRID